MVVVFVITNLSVGGAETMLLKLLQKLDRERYKPTVISLVGVGEIGGRIKSLNIPVFALGMSRGVPNPLSFFRLVRVLKRIKPDVIHTWMYHADLLGGLSARMAGCARVVWCIRNGDLSKDKTSVLTRVVVRVCASLSKYIPSYIVSCSHRASEIHVSLGYPMQKMLVIPNGFDLERFVPDPQSRMDVRAELGLPPEAPLVGLIARFDPQKNHFGFVEAAGMVCAVLPQAHFVLAGEGVDCLNLELTDAIAAHGLQKHVHLLGRRNDMPRLMASLDVLASSSAYGEAFPNVLGEAMACGVPCVVTDVGDSSEIVGRAGIVVPRDNMVELADGLLAILRLSSEEKIAISREARNRVSENYEIGRVVKSYEALFDQVFSEIEKRGL